jgi:Ca2+-binding EF-hand superfamily protein
VIKSGAALSTAEKRQVEAVVDRLFEIFDTNGDGSIDFSELASGLSVLCGGNREDKVEAAFALYDLDGDGTISLDEMTTYLTSVFKVLYETQPGTAERMGVSAEELAAVTAEQAFVDADLNHDGKLSFEEFKRWYAESADDVPAVSRDSMASLGMDETRRLVKLDVFDVKDVFEIFAEAAPDGYLTKQSFQRSFDLLIDSGGGHANDSEANAASMVIDRLFSVFDADDSGTVDFGELASGLSIMCGSSMDDKVKAAFSLYDVNEDGFISLEEMTIYMKSIFNIMYETSADMHAKMGVSPAELAEVTAQQCFKDADLNHDGKLSFEEFREWCTQSM